MQYTVTTTNYIHTLLLVVTVTLLLAGFWPASSFAQTATGSAATLDDEVVTVTSEAATTTDTTPNRPTDNYQREELPSPETYNDFVVGPGRFEVELAPGDSATVELLITNRMGVGKLFKLTTEDAVGSASGSEAIKLLGDEVGPYTLRDYISVPHEEFYLEHGTRVRVPVTISLPADAEPGGHYGSILTSITTSADELGQSSGANPATAVISRIGTLFFVSTPGEVEHDNELIDFSTPNNERLFWEGPIDFSIVHENSGSVHTKPYGVVSITNILGEEVGRTEIEPWFVMPQSVRTREISWDRELLLGRYTATAEINRGYDDNIDTATYTFYVIPWKLTLAIFSVLFVFFLVVRFIFSRFEFKRKA